MNSPTHILIAETLFSRKLVAGASWAAATGALVPDVFLAFFVIYGLATGLDGNTLWNIAYFQEPWTTIGSVSNSIPLWLAIALCGYFAQKQSRSDRQLWYGKLVCIFAFSGLLHVLVDLTTHAEDAHQHFWPISNWKFHSPISYWDPAHSARWVMLFEGMLVFTSTFLLWSRAKSRRIKFLLALTVLYGALLIVGSQLR